MQLGSTPLMKASGEKHSAIVQVLLSEGAHVNDTNNVSLTLCFEAEPQRHTVVYLYASFPCCLLKTKC